MEYETLKVFEDLDLPDDLPDDLFGMLISGYGAYNDSYIKFYINEEPNEEYKEAWARISDLLVQAGCAPDEAVLLRISW